MGKLSHLLLSMLPYTSPGSPLPWIAAGLALAAVAGLVLLARARRLERDRALGALDRVADLAGLLIARCDLQGRWTRVPAGLCDLLGREEAGLLGHPIFECLHAEDQEGCRTHCAELLQGNRPSCELEARATRPDGQEAWIQLDGTPVAGRSGQTRYIQVIVRDISEAKAVAQALRDSEEKFRILSEHINCGVFLYTDVFHYINPGMEAITGYAAAELLGQPFWKPVHPDEQELVRQRGMARRRGEPVPDRYVLKILHKDGHTIHTDFIARAVILGGKVYGLGTAFDISDRVKSSEDRLRMERQLLEAQKLESLGLLAGGIAHDFNNLLTVILGNASIIVEEAASHSLTSACATTVVETCQRASGLTRQMLAYSGKGRFRVEPQDLNSVLQGITSLVESSLPKLIELRYELGNGLPGLEADRTQLQQVILNLVTNAAESIGPKAGTTILRTGFQVFEDADLQASFPGQGLAPGPYVFLEVADTGAGMDEATRGRIFEPFFTTKGAGRGLGLAAMQGIVRGHRGGIWIYSVPDRGTTFRVILPALPTPVAVTEGVAVPVDGWQGHGLVLVVEDEASLRSLAALALRRVGFEVVEAADGREGVEMFRRHAHQLRAVLLDLVMPVQGGESALAEMMAVRAEVPVILSSGYEGESQGRGLAGRPFLQKPYTVAELVAKLRGVAPA